MVAMLGENELIAHLESAFTLSMTAPDLRMAILSCSDKPEHYLDCCSMNTSLHSLIKLAQSSKWIAKSLFLRIRDNGQLGGMNGLLARLIEISPIP